MKRYIDAEELSTDILDGEIEITGEGSEFAQQAVLGYRSAILRRIMAQPTENVIPVEFIEVWIEMFNEMCEDGEISEMAHAAITTSLKGLLDKWEKEKDEWLHKEGGEP